MGQLGRYSATEISGSGAGPTEDPPVPSIGDSTSQNQPSKPAHDGGDTRPDPTADPCPDGWEEP